MLRNIPILPKNRLLDLTDIILAKISIKFFIDFFYIRFDSGGLSALWPRSAKAPLLGEPANFPQFLRSDRNRVEINAYVFEHFESLQLAGSFCFTREQFPASQTQCQLADRPQSYRLG